MCLSPSHWPTMPASLPTPGPLSLGSLHLAPQTSASSRQMLDQVWLASGHVFPWVLPRARPRSQGPRLGLAGAPCGRPKGSWQWRLDSADLQGHVAWQVVTAPAVTMNTGTGQLVAGS